MKKALTYILFAFFFLLIASCSHDRKELLDNRDLYRVRIGSKCGFINERGKLVIEPQFDDAHLLFGDGVCFAVSGERKGLINSEGVFVVEIDNSIDWIYRFNNGVATFLTNNGETQGTISKSGNIILPAIYKQIIQDGEIGFIVQDTLGQYGYLNVDGDFILPCNYTYVRGFSEGLMAVKVKDKWGYVDTTGAWVIDSIYNNAFSFGNGLARVKVGERWQFINYKEEVAERLEYDEILTGFSCNRAFVRNGTVMQLIDTLGTIIAEINADSVAMDNKGFALFLKKGEFGIIDTTGVICVQPSYDSLELFNDGFACFKQNGKRGIIKTNGDIVIDAFHNSAIVEINNMFWGVDTIKGEVLMTIYDRSGNQIWKDMPSRKYILPEKPTKKDYMTFFDSRLSELDPIEGIYYTTSQEIYQYRDNPSQTGSNGTESMFYAVIKSSLNDNDFFAYCIDKPGYHWVKKFVRLGESETYAIMNTDTTNQFASNSRLFLDNPYKINFRLEKKHNNWYNFFVDYEFIKEYPPQSEYEKVLQVDWTGTGFAIADGYIATNYHVTNGARTINVRGVNGEMKDSYKGYVVASDKNHDLSIVKIIDTKFNGFKPIPYSMGKVMPEVGNDIFILGYPLTSTMGNEVKLTEGIISAASGYKGDQSMFQISAAVQPGNSGGPLFDNNGNIIGIVCAKHAEAENANYAIKVSYLYSLVNSSGIGIKMADNNKIRTKSLAKKAKQVYPFVYLIECSSH